MNLINKLVCISLKQDKKRTAVTIIGIAVFLAMITAASSLCKSLIQTRIDYERYTRGNFHVVFYGVSENNIETFQNNRKIEAIYLTQDIGYANIASQNQRESYAVVKGFTQSALENLSVRLVAGRLPQNEHEILIPMHLITTGRMTCHIGDELHLNLGKRAHSTDRPHRQTEALQGSAETEPTMDASSRSYTVVGLMELPSAAIELDPAPGYTLITFLNEAELQGAVDSYVRFADSAVKSIYRYTAYALGADAELFEKTVEQRHHSDAAFEEYQQQLAGVTRRFAFHMDLITLETNPFKLSNIRHIGIIAIFIVSFLVLVSILSIKNNFEIILKERGKRYGMLRCIGATTGQIRKVIFYNAVILQTLAVPPGLLLGFIATYAITRADHCFFGAALASGLHLRYSFSYETTLFASIIDLIVIYILARRGAVRASRMSPVTPLKNSAFVPINAREGTSQRAGAKARDCSCPAIYKKIFGAGVEISYKNLKRNKNSYKATVTAIVISVIVLISMPFCVDIIYDEVESLASGMEVNLRLNAYDFDEATYKKILETTQFENVVDYSVCRSEVLVHSADYYSKAYREWRGPALNGKSANPLIFYAVGRAQFQKYVESLGFTYDQMRDKAILCDYVAVPRSRGAERSKYMRVFSQDQGAQITGMVENRAVELTIGAVSVTRPLGLRNSDSAILVVSDEFFDKIASTNSIMVAYHATDADQLQNQIEASVRDGSYSLYNKGEEFKMMNDLFRHVRIFLIGFIVVIVLISAANISRVITIKMELRRPEFALLKSAGMTNREFRSMAWFESVFLGTKSLLFGMTVGIALSYLLHYFCAKETGRPFQMPVLLMLFVTLLVFGAIFLNMRSALQKISEQSTIETIQMKLFNNFG